MKKIWFIIISVFTLFSCQSRQQTDALDQNDQLDSLNIDQNIKQYEKVPAKATLQADIYELDYDNREILIL